MKIWLTSICLLATISSASATSIAVMRRPKYIVSASDSMQLSFEGGKWVTEPLCKVNFVGKYIFSSTGLVNDPSADYYSAKIISPFVKSPLLKRGAVIADALKPAVLRALRMMHKTLPRDYARFFGGNDHVFGTAILGMEHGVPTVVTIELIKTNYRNGAPRDLTSKIDACPGPTCRPIGKYFILGQTKEIKHRLDAGTFKWTGNDVDDLRRIVEIEVEDKPDIVGKPIAIIGIDGSGHHWSNKGVCDEQGEKGKEPKATQR